MGAIGCIETHVTNYQSTLRNIPEEYRFHLRLDGSLKPLMFKVSYRVIIHSIANPAKSHCCPINYYPILVYLAVLSQLHSIKYYDGSQL